MIRISDATVLALTKLRTRKVRTTVTVILASLLFSGLVFASNVVGGVIGSARSFTDGSLANRYITIADYSILDPSQAPDNPKIQARATALYNKLIAEKKAEAKKLNVAYDPAMEQRPVASDPDGSKYLDTSSPSAQKALAEYKKDEPSAREKAQKQAAAYNPIGHYTFLPSTIDGTVKEMKNGKEILDEKAEAMQNSYTTSQDLSSGWYYLNQSVVESFLLPKQQLASQGNSNNIPIIAPHSHVEKALGLKTLPRTATPEEKLKRIKQVRSKASSATFTVCYRNDISQQRIDEAISVAADIKKNKSNKEYQKPSLIYSLPKASTCGPAIIATDTRTIDEKKYADNQALFDKKFGENPESIQQKVTFRVVGIAPDAPDYSSFSAVGGLVSALAGQSLQGQWVVPQTLYDNLPNKAAYKRFASTMSNTKANQLAFNTLPPGQLVEFSSAAAAKSFSEKEGCTGFDCGKKPFISYFGSSSVLLQDILVGATNVLAIAGIIIAGLSALIMMGMIGRVITDSRRETAVFRAIGARRGDISLLYGLYTVFLSLLIALAAVAIGLILSLWVDKTWSSEATIQAQLTFASAAENEVFHLTGIWWQAITGIICLVLLTGIISMILPLALNLRRSPIKDMRDDT